MKSKQRFCLTSVDSIAAVPAQDTADRQKQADAAVGERNRLSALLVRRNEELAKATEKVRVAGHTLPVIRTHSSIF